MRYRKAKQYLTLKDETTPRIKKLSQCRCLDTYNKEVVVLFISVRISSSSVYKDDKIRVKERKDRKCGIGKLSSIFKSFKITSITL